MIAIQNNFIDDTKALTVERILTETRSWIGTPYRHQGRMKHVGCDCLGLVRGVWHAVYGEETEEPGPYRSHWIETSSTDNLLEKAATYCQQKAQVNDLAPGDLIVFRWHSRFISKHVAIMDENDCFIHAYSGHGVMRAALVPAWRKRISGIFAFPSL